MSLISLGNNMYKIRLKIYRDVTGARMPTTESLTIKRNSDNGTVQTISLPRIQQYPITYDAKECLAPGANTKLEMHIYESAATNFSALNSTAGYYATNGTCCRAPGIVNVLNSSSAGIQFVMDFPRLNTTSPYINNSSPEFKSDPLTYFCVGKSYAYDMNVVDPNGDSLVFSLVQNLDGGTSKPFSTIDYAPGYNLLTNIMDGLPDINVNAQTGLVSFIATRAGRYLIAIKCEEYRNGVKIGEIRREFMLETVVCNDIAPISKVNDSIRNTFVDTIFYGENYKINFKSFDSPTDTLEMILLPRVNIDENIFNPNTYNAKWGVVGKTDSLVQIIQGVGTVESEFAWTPKCEHVRDKPYAFTIITRDRTCPQPLYDTTFVELFVVKIDNKEPYFILPDTVKRYSLKNYFIREGDAFQLNGDSILKAYDYDSSQVIAITYLPEPNNGSVNTLFEFNSFPDSIYATASFVWNSTCNTSRSEPYNVKFFVVDNDCLKPDTATFEINIYVLEGVKAYQIQGNTQIIDTSLIYTYTTLNQTGVSYNWYGQNVKIISGQGTNSVNVKLNKVDAELSCEVTDIVATCKDTSSLIIGNFVGVDNTSKTEYKIYPNPTEGIINIEALIKTKSSIVKIYSVQGKLILTKEFKDNGIIDINDFSKGVYLIKIDESVFKIVKH
ncbi:MAG: T9SS type A sorting domain-containing protein [bacterium]